MYSNDKERLRRAIHDLIEKDCFICPINEMAKNKNNQKNEHCEGCSTLRALEYLGKLLTPNDLKFKQQRHVAFERFVELFESGMKNKDIAIMLNCSTKTVGKRKKDWLEGKK